MGSSAASPSPSRAVRAGYGKGFVLIAVVYLLGLFIGALDTGIVTPARTVIQGDLGITDQMSVWIITVYTLAYAAAIPVMGKLADRSGRKRIYLVSIALFGAGSLLCGLAQDVGSFWMLLGARAVQAVGGGGIVPVATAEFGTTFPPEKRGLALGLVGGVYGIANIFGASAGSLILSLFGQTNWQFIFYVNVPICAAIVAVGVFVLPNTRAEEVKPIDGFGIAVLVTMVLALLYGLKNLDFFDVGASIASTDVWPFLLAFVVLLPLFVLIERRAADPVLNLSYFRNRDILVTLVLSVITGVILMGIIFIPQFAENVLKLPSGSGGYVVIVLAAFAGVGAPVSGKLIDRFGVKAVLAFGLAASAAGALFLALVATRFANMVTLIVSLVAIGIGMGFTIGTPLNYMMLAKTKESESNSALATLSLVRSVGTAVAPAVLVAFIAHAGMAPRQLVKNDVEVDITGWASFNNTDSGAKLTYTLDGTPTGITLTGNMLKAADDASTVSTFNIKVTATATTNFTAPTEKVIVVNVVTKSDAGVSITTPPTSKTYGDANFSLAATKSASAPDGGTWSWNSSNPAILEIISGADTATPTIKVKKADTTGATLTVTYTSDTHYGSASAAITVAQKEVTISGITAANKEYDGSTTATPTGTAVINGKVGSDDVTVTAGQKAT